MLERVYKNSHNFYCYNREDLLLFQLYVINFTVCNLWIKLHHTYTHPRWKVCFATFEHSSQNANVYYLCVTYLSLAVCANESLAIDAVKQSSKNRTLVPERKTEISDLHNARTIIYKRYHGFYIRGYLEFAFSRDTREFIGVWKHFQLVRIENFSTIRVPRNKKRTCFSKNMFERKTRFSAELKIWKVQISRQVDVQFYIEGEEIFTERGKERES